MVQRCSYGDALAHLAIWEGVCVGGACVNLHMACACPSRNGMHDGEPGGTCDGSLPMLMLRALYHKRTLSHGGVPSLLQQQVARRLHPPTKRLLRFSSSISSSVGPESASSSSSRAIPPGAVPRPPPAPARGKAADATAPPLGTCPPPGRVHAEAGLSCCCWSSCREWCAAAAARSRGRRRWRPTRKSKGSATEDAADAVRLDVAALDGGFCTVSLNSCTVEVWRRGQGDWRCAGAPPRGGCGRHRWEHEGGQAGPLACNALPLGSMADMERLELRCMLAAMLISCLRGSPCVEWHAQWHGESVQREFLALPAPVPKEYH